jgi:hypothetical protein
MTLTPQQREEVLEAMARTILIADGAAIFRDDDAWADELWRHRKLCAEIPTYPDAPCALSTAFRQASAALDAALPVIWRGCLDGFPPPDTVSMSGGTIHLDYEDPDERQAAMDWLCALAEETR